MKVNELIWCKMNKSAKKIIDSLTPNELCKLMRRMPRLAGKWHPHFSSQVRTTNFYVREAIRSTVTPRFDYQDETIVAKVWGPRVTDEAGSWMYSVTESAAGYANSKEEAMKKVDEILEEEDWVLET